MGIGNSKTLLADDYTRSLERLSAVEMHISKTLAKAESIEQTVGDHGERLEHISANLHTQQADLLTQKETAEEMALKLTSGLIEVKTLLSHLQVNAETLTALQQKMEEMQVDMVRERRLISEEVHSVERDLSAEIQEYRAELTNPHSLEGQAELKDEEALRLSSMISELASEVEARLRTESERIDDLHEKITEFQRGTQWTREDVAKFHNVEVSELSPRVEEAFIDADTNGDGFVSPLEYLEQSARRKKKHR